MVNPCVNLDCAERFVLAASCRECRKQCDVEYSVSHLYTS